MVKILLSVETSSGTAGNGAPVAFALRDRIFKVREIVDHWDGIDHAYYKVIADDGNLYVIRHDLEENQWEMMLMEATAPDERRS